MATGWRVPRRKTAAADDLCKSGQSTATEQPLGISLDGVASVAGTDEAEILSADPAALNTMEQPVRVAPVTVQVAWVKPNFRYEVPAHSVVVLKLNQFKILQLCWRDSRSLTTPGVNGESIFREPLKVYERTDYANV